MDLLGSNGLKEQKSEERSEKKIMVAIHFQKLELQFWELVHNLLYENILAFCITNFWYWKTSYKKWLYILKGRE